MKKIYSQLSYCMVFLFVILLQHSCSHDHTDCSDCQITQEEKAFLSVYNKGDKVIFKNDVTAISDTLYVQDKGTHPSGCSSPCNNTAGSIFATISSSHLAESRIWLYHASSPFIRYENFGSNGSYSFFLNNTMQTITVNSTTYNDIYSVTVDSNTVISYNDQLKVPWKIDYSKSKGFVRFHMTSNGGKWSKL